MVDKWREAVAKKLLTPAPDLGAITWKRAKLKSRDFSYLTVKKERVERVIADDVAFLDAHPTRRRRPDEQLAISEAPAPPIDEKAQPAAAGRPCQKAKAVMGNNHGLPGWRGPSGGH